MTDKEFLTKFARKPPDKQLEDLLCQYKDVFADTIKDIQVITTTPPYIARLKIGGKPYHCPGRLPQRNPQHEEHYKARIKEHEEMIKAGWFEEVQQPFAAAQEFLVFSGHDELTTGEIQEKEAKPRWVIDYRGYNQSTEPIPFEMPTSQEVQKALLEITQGGFIWQADVTKAYHHIAVEKHHANLLVVRTFNGRYLRPSRMLFGIHNAPRAWQGFMKYAFEPLVQRRLIAPPYIDDTAGGGKTIQQHDHSLEEFLKICRRHCIKLAPKKMALRQQEISLLGSRVTTKGIHIDPGRVKSLLGLPKPAKIEDLQAIIGKFGYFAHYIPNYTKTIAPLMECKNNVVNKKGKLEELWQNKQSVAFEEIKQALVNHATLELQAPGEPIRVNTDASPYGVGWIIYQATVPPRLLGLGSRNLPKLVQFKTAREQPQLFNQQKAELYAVYYAMVTNPWMTNQEVIIYTDNQALTKVTNPDTYLSKASTEPPTGAERRMIFFLQGLNVSFKWIKGSENGFSDYLSRAGAIALGGRPDPFPKDIKDNELEQEVSIENIQMDNQEQELLWPENENNYDSDPEDQAYDYDLPEEVAKARERIQEKWEEHEALEAHKEWRRIKGQELIKSLPHSNPKEHHLFSKEQGVPKEFLQIGSEHKQQEQIRRRGYDLAERPRKPRPYGNKPSYQGEPKEWAAWEAKKEEIVNSWQEQRPVWEPKRNGKNKLQDWQADVYKWETTIPTQSHNEPAWYPQQEEDPTWTPDRPESFMTENAYGREGVQKRFNGQVHTEESDSEKENHQPENPWTGAVDQVETEVWWNTFFKAAREGIKSIEEEIGELPKEESIGSVTDLLKEIDEIQGQMWKKDQQTNTWTTTTNINMLTARFGNFNIHHDFSTRSHTMEHKATSAVRKTLQQPRIVVNEGLPLLQEETRLPDTLPKQLVYGAKAVMENLRSKELMVIRRDKSLYFRNEEEGSIEMVGWCIYANHKRRRIGEEPEVNGIRLPIEETIGGICLYCYEPVMEIPKEATLAYMEERIKTLEWNAVMIQNSYDRLEREAQEDAELAQNLQNQVTELREIRRAVGARRTRARRISRNLRSPIQIAAESEADESDVETPEEVNILSEEIIDQQVEQELQQEAALEETPVTIGNIVERIPGDLPTVQELLLTKDQLGTSPIRVLSCFENIRVWHAARGGF
ncbi:hypothetical protein BC936DRAFT_136826 [Jimgerdemannia flammicorona]|uniref:Reverse transcriptase domain-containing protein n=1 Tax=Jimgerdemannia flammicorona TaxID=994334 RepID=A0A433CYQ6_9FUNG|nr:hypothetical protein BC936DRAFT_136826 [Jimgerdemannia flammicorona]